MHQQTVENYNKVKKLMADGMSAAEASVKIGKSKNWFYSVNRPEKKAAKPKRGYKRKVRVIDLPQSAAPLHQTGLRLLVFSGDPADLVRIAKSF